jgi:hypothetical protein
VVLAIGHTLRAHEALGCPDALPGFLEVVHRLFEAYVEHALAPTLEAGRVMIMDNLPTHKPNYCERCCIPVILSVIPRASLHKEAQSSYM